MCAYYNPAFITKIFSILQVSDLYDLECRRYRPCRELTGPFETCHESLRFNRNTGMCDLPANVFCTIVLLPPRCPAGYTGFFPGARCFDYIYCENGETLLNLQCNVGMYFNEAAGSCLYDTDNTCRRTASLMEDSEDIPDLTEDLN